MPRARHVEEAGVPELSQRQEHEAQKRVPVPALVVHEAIRKQGEDELARPVSALAWSGLAAGLSMSFSFMAEGILRAHLPDAPWRHLLVSLGYPAGFIIVIIARQQLFTENTLTAVIPVLAGRRWITARKALRLWAVVLTANLIGAHIAAWVLGNTGLFPPEVRNAFDELGREAIHISPGLALLKGVFSGWLIALMVWMLAAARTQVGIILILTYLCGLGQFTHVIAGSTDVLFLVFTGAHGWLDWAIAYLLPTLAGNIIGGVSLVSVLNHAQVVAGHD